MTICQLEMVLYNHSEYALTRVENFYLKQSLWSSN
jgi:hypothetical protein